MLCCVDNGNVLHWAKRLSISPHIHWRPRASIIILSIYALILTKLNRQLVIRHSILNMFHKMLSQLYLKINYKIKYLYTKRLCNTILRLSCFLQETHSWSSWWSRFCISMLEHFNKLHTSFVRNIAIKLQNLLFFDF